MRYLIPLIFMASTFSVSAQIRISKAKGVDVSSYKTFAVQKGQVLSLFSDEKINESKIFRVIKESVIRELELRGYVYVEDSIAQLVVSYVYEEKPQAAFQKAGPLGQSPTTNAAVVDASETSTSLKERTLILDVVKGSDNGSIWTANCTLNGTQKDPSGVMDQTVTSALKKFPMQGKSK
jgi:hypothetical protein